MEQDQASNALLIETNVTVRDRDTLYGRFEVARKSAVRFLPVFRTGGGAQLTANGREVLDAYRAACAGAVLDDHLLVQ